MSKLNKPFLYLLFIFLFFALTFTAPSYQFFKHSLKIYIISAFSFIAIFYFFKSKTLRFSRLSLFIFIFLIYSFFVTYFGYYKPDGLFLLYFLFILYIVFIFIENSDNLNNSIIKGIFLISFIDAIYSYFEFCMKSLGYFGHKIIPYFVLISPVNSIGGFLYQPNLNSLLINIGLIITAFWILEAKDKRDLIYLFVIYAFFAYVAALTQSRAGMLAVLSVFFAIFIAQRFFALNLSKKKRRLVVLMLLFYIVVLVINKLSPLAKFEHNGLIEDNSVMKRIMIWIATIMLWLKHPLFGTGLETFKFLNNPYQIKACHFLHIPFDIISNFVWAHNEMIQILEELGIFAFLSILIITVIYYFRQFKNNKEISDWLAPSLLLLFIVQAGLSWPLRHPFFLTLFFVILGLIKKQHFIELSGYRKNIAVSVLAVIYLGSTIYFIPHIKNDIKTTFAVQNTKNIDKKLSILYKASNDPYLFWIASSQFICKAVPYYFKITTGINHLPLIKEDVKNKRMTKEEQKKAEKLRKEILQEDKSLEKLHKIWLSEYYLSLAYLINGDLKKAKIHAKKGLAMNSNPPYMWNLLHYINVKCASMKTGKPIVYFLPTKGEVENLFKTMQRLKKEFKSNS